jgi:hypothetical protein
MPDEEKVMELEEILANLGRLGWHTTITLADDGHIAEILAQEIEHTRPAH